jgi:hypothetical protein
MEATCAAGKSGSRLGFPGRGARMRDDVATECGTDSGAGGKRKADPQGLALILIFRWCTLAGMMGKGGGGVARCLFAHALAAQSRARKLCKRSAQRSWPAGRDSCPAGVRSEGVRD